MGRRTTSSPLLTSVCSFSSTDISTPLIKMSFLIELKVSSASFWDSSCSISSKSATLIESSSSSSSTFPRVRLSAPRALTRIKRDSFRKASGYLDKFFPDKLTLVSAWCMIALRVIFRNPLWLSYLTFLLRGFQ